MIDRIQIKERAKACFKANSGTCRLTCLVFALLSGASSGVFGLGVVFLVLPLSVGMAYFFACIYRGLSPTLSTMFECSFYDYLGNVCGMLLVAVYTFLWSLLFVIPGIVKALSYSMTPYLLADHPGLNASRAIKLSMRMTEGRKMDLFVMGLSFIGWEILSLFTFGILSIVFVWPYSQASFAGLYEELKKECITSGRISQDEFQAG